MTTAERLTRVETILAGQDEKLDKILAHAEKTNGRVNEHDRWIAEHGGSVEAIPNIQALVNKGKGVLWLLSIAMGSVGTLIGIVLKSLL